MWVRLFLAHRQRMQYRWMMLGFEIRGKGQKLGIIYCYGLAARPLPVQWPARLCLPRQALSKSVYSSSTSILPLWSSAFLFVPSTPWLATSLCWEPIQSPRGNDLPTVGHPWWLVPFAGSPHVLLQDGKKGHPSPWSALKTRICQLTSWVTGNNSSKILSCYRTQPEATWFCFFLVLSQMERA